MNFHLGNLHYFLGTEVIYTKDGLFLSQSKYGLDLLDRVFMKDCKPIFTPLSTSHQPRKTVKSVPPSSITSYRRIHSALQY